MKKRFGAALGLLLLTGLVPPPARVGDLAWMSGRWQTAAAADGSWTEEVWSSPRGGVMLGYSRSGRGET